MSFLPYQDEVTNPSEAYQAAELVHRRRDAITHSLM